MNASNAYDPWSIFSDFPPRRWQVDALPRCWASITSKRRGVMQACTGAGKTRLQLAILGKINRTLKPGWSVVVSAPRQALVEQTVEEGKRFLGPSVVGEWYGRRKKASRITVVCHDSADSLADYLSMRGIRVAHWMADEVHRADTDRMIEAVRRWDPKTRIGVTATPFRSVETEALRGWDDIVYRYTIDQAIDEGVLVPWVPHYCRPEEADADTNVVVRDMILRHAPPGPGIVSANDMKDAEWYARYLGEAGIDALAVHSKMKTAERRRRIDLLLSGGLRCLVHVDLLTEGVDLPPLRWLAMRRRRKGAVGIVQEVGRVLRTMRTPDRWGEKTHAVLLLPHATGVLQATSTDPRIQAEELRKKAEAELEDKPWDCKYLPCRTKGIEPDEAICPECGTARGAKTLAKERTIPTATAVGDIADWIERLVEACVVQGVKIDPAPETLPLGDWWRLTAPSSKQIDFLRHIVEDGKKSPTRYLDEENREALKTLLDNPEGLTRGSASDLLDLFSGLRSRASAHAKKFARAPKSRRFWKGAKKGLPAPPVLAIRSIETHWADNRRRA